MTCCFPWSGEQDLKLVHVDIAGLELLQRSLQISPEPLGRFGLGLRGDIDLVAKAAVIAEHQTELVLAIAVSAGGVEIAHTALVSAPQQRHRLVIGHALDGQRPKRVLRHRDARASQCDVAHSHFLPYTWCLNQIIAMSTIIIPTRERLPRLHPTPLPPYPRTEQRVPTREPRPSPRAMRRTLIRLKEAASCPSSR